MASMVYGCRPWALVGNMGGRTLRLLGGALEIDCRHAQKVETTYVPTLGGLLFDFFQLSVSLQKLLFDFSQLAGSLQQLVVDCSQLFNNFQMFLFAASGSIESSFGVVKKHLFYILSTSC